MKSLGAPIISFEEYLSLKPKLGKIVVTSGGFDPIHPGHISCFQEAKKLGDTLVVVINGDTFLRNKKGKPFQDIQTRSAVVSAVHGVDYVLPFEIENDQTVCRALEIMKPHVFANGGDRKDKDSIPEWEVCRKFGIELIQGVGADKRWSSSDFLREWVLHVTKNV